MIESYSVENEWIEPVPGRRETPAAGRRSGIAPAVSPAPVFAVTSGKGGVGKTNVVANLATALARGGKKILAIDADLGLANLDLILDVKPQHTLADFFAGHVALENVLVANRDGVLVLPGASGVQEITALDRDQKAALLTELDGLTQKLDLVLIDTGSGISDGVTYFTTAAQEIVIVVAPEPTSITDAYALIKVLASQHRQKRFWILANSVAGEDEARRLFGTLSGAALRFLNSSLDFLGWIPRDAELVRAVTRGQTVVMHAPDSPSARAFDGLAERLARMAGAVRVKGNVQFFFRRMLEREKGC
jgi:flagellar biosynthesis protein FlhG